jgi:hypothetical protein
MQIISYSNTHHMNGFLSMPSFQARFLSFLKEQTIRIIRSDSEAHVRKGWVATPGWRGIAAAQQGSWNSQKYEGHVQPCNTMVLLFQFKWHSKLELTEDHQDWSQINLQKGEDGVGAMSGENRYLV